MEDRGQQHRPGRRAVRQQRRQRPPVRRTGWDQHEAGEPPEPGGGEQQIPVPAGSGGHPDRKTEDVRCEERQPDGSRLPDQHLVVTRVVEPLCPGALHGTEPVQGAAHD